MKRFFSSADSSVGFLASINLAAAAGASALTRVEEFISTTQHVIQFFVPLGQVAVAGATVYYILRKAKSIPIPSVKKTGRHKK